MNIKTLKGGGRRLAVVAAAFGLVVAACGGDDDSADTTPATTQAPAPDTDDDAAGDDDAGEDDAGEDNAGDDSAGDDEVHPLDFNADGVVRMGVATPGPRDDGAYYQALVEGVNSFSESNGFESPIVVDNISQAQAETELRNLARQGVDVIAVGASEIADSLETLAVEFPDIFWYCNCGAASQFEGVAQSGDDSSQIQFSAGYATGLLLAETDSTLAAFLGCCDLGFEQEAYNAFAMGLKAADESFEMTYIPTGDFNDVAGATEAFNQAVAAGAGAVNPFLGGAHEAIVSLANEAGIVTMSAGASNVCERTDLDYQIAVQFDAGDYLEVIFEQILSGDLSPGETLMFNVGDYPFVGAKFCDATAEQEAALEAMKERIAAGEFADEFFAIKAEAYGF